MQISAQQARGADGVAIISYLVVTLVIMVTLAAVSASVIHSLKMSHRRQNMINAYQVAQGGAALACGDVQVAFTNRGGLLDNLTSGEAAYVLNAGKSTKTNLFYERTVTSPFENQTIHLALDITNATSPDRIKVTATATVGQSTQNVESFLELKFEHGGAIISTHSGTTSTGATKATAQAGNVALNASGNGISIVDGGVSANGKVNVNQAIVDFVSQENLGTEKQIPDYTDPGSQHQLFDFEEFTAVADAMGTHYTNLTEFVAAAAPGNTLEGVIVVDVPKDGLAKLDPSTLPYGINVRGTLCFKFSPEWNPMDKVVNTATMNINAADLSGLVPGNRETYPTGYPPVFSDSSKDPTKILLAGMRAGDAAGDKGGKGGGNNRFNGFKPGDDLPALMYNNAILDIHGNANICGVIYSPSFLELENKQAGQIQYVRGSIIGGGGVYVENMKRATTLVTYDPAALDFLATYAGRGKNITMVYQR